MPNDPPPSGDVEPTIDIHAAATSLVWSWIAGVTVGTLDVGESADRRHQPDHWIVGPSPIAVDESSIPDSESDPDDESTSPLPAEVAVSELDVVAAAAGLEALAVEAYTIAREAATAGSFGQVPPAIVNYLDTAYGHHQVALETWNRVLAAAGRPTVVEAPADLATAVAEQFAAAIDGAGAARVVLGVERTAAATYLNAAGGPGL